jgi:hypothetical protein
MVPFNFNRGSKSSLGSALLAAIETGRLALYADDGSLEYATCLDELQTCTMELLPGGQIAWGNDRGHDDYVASLALCLHAASTLGEPRVARGRSRAS